MTIETDDITPHQAAQGFENARDFILDAILRTVPGFDIHADRERFWQLVDCGVQVEKLLNPVRLEEVLSIVDEFAALALKIAIQQEQGESHAHLH